MKLNLFALFVVGLLTGFALAGLTIPSLFDRPTDKVAAEAATASAHDGRLGLPLGQPVTVVGVVERGGSKLMSPFMLRALSINGVPVDGDVYTSVRSFGVVQPRGWGWAEALGSDDESATLEFDQTYEFYGYETGGYGGIPDEIYDEMEELVATSGFHFRSEFVAVRVHSVDLEQQPE